MIHQALGSLIAAATCVGTLTMPGNAVAQALFSTNLVTNGNAETDAGSATGSTIGPVTGFAATGTFTVVLYGAAGGFPTATDSGPIDRGLNFFAGGPSAASSSGTQLIDLSSGVSAIDLGTVSFDLSAYLGGFSSQRDNATLTVSFLSTANSTLGSASIGPVTSVDRGNSTGLLFRETSGLVPVAARTAQITLQLTRVDGSYNDGYADNLSLVLSAVPEPTPAALLAVGLVLLGLRTLRSNAGDA